MRHNCTPKDPDQASLLDYQGVRLCCHKGVWRGKRQRGSKVKLCVCVGGVWALCGWIVCVGQSFSQLSCCSLTMAVLSAEVLRWHVSFHFTLCISV